MNDRLFVMLPSSSLMTMTPPADVRSDTTSSKSELEGSLAASPIYSSPSSPIALEMR